MMQSAYGVGVRELDLTASPSSSLTHRINAVPVLRTSAAFFVFLRANLALDQHALSTCNTPKVRPYVDLSPTAPPSPSLTASSSSTMTSQTESLLSLDDIPPLQLEPLRLDTEKEQAVHLIAESIRQMRWAACKSLLLHPISLAGVTTTVSALHSLTKDPWMTLTLSCAVLLLGAQAVRFYTAGYTSRAENITPEFFTQPDGTDDVIIGARYKDEVVATAVLHLELPVNLSSPRKKHSRTSSMHGGKGIIRAWTTRADVREVGVGRDVLFEAVRITKGRCGKDAKIGFAKEHANSTMLLPNMFNAQFRKREVRATKTLESVLAEWETCRRRR